MVVCAVRYEPVSLLFAQYQGDFRKNSEPAGENSKNPCSTGISRTWRQFNIREEQGTPNFHNSDRAFNELGRRRWAAGRLGATTQGRALAVRVCSGSGVVSAQSRRHAWWHVTR